MKRVLLFLAFLFTVSIIHAEVHYTSFGEGMVIDGAEGVVIDIDNDGVTDFTANPFEGNIGLSPYLGCYVRNWNTSYEAPAIRTMDEDENIGEDDMGEFEDFDHGDAYDASRGWADGWANDEPKLIGFMLFNTYSFGWMRVVPNSSTGTLTILEWAYADPGESINAGYRGFASFLNDTDEMAISVKAFPNPATNYIRVVFEDNSPVSSLSIVNLAGQAILEENSPSALREGWFSFDVSEWGVGEYFVILRDGSKVIGRKQVLITR